jgi:hypothetical protein
MKISKYIQKQTLAATSMNFLMLLKEDIDLSCHFITNQKFLRREADVRQRED